MYTGQIQSLLVVFGLLGPCVVASLGPHHHDHLHDLHLNLPDKRLLLDDFSEPISITGEHEFRPPGEGDQRGPCPGLNALANHGYIPRDGVVSLLGAIGAMNEVYGVSIELAAILAVMGTVWTGNPVSLNPSFSIGGTDPEVQNLLGNLLGLLGMITHRSCSNSANM